MRVEQISGDLLFRVDPPGTIHHLSFDHRVPPPAERKDLSGDGKVQTYPTALMGNIHEACSPPDDGFCPTKTSRQ